jgi:hypothetical protein
VIVHGVHDEARKFAGDVLVRGVLVLRPMSLLEDFQQNLWVRGQLDNARRWERDMDSDRDGSVIDQVGAELRDKLPGGKVLGGPIEDLGDGITDLLGTRDEGIFTHASTRDTETTTDVRYRGDGIDAAGTGQIINEALGGVDVDPAEAMLTMAGAPAAAFAFGTNVADAIAPDSIYSVSEMADMLLRDVGTLDESEY